MRRLVRISVDIPAWQSWKLRWEGFKGRIISWLKFPVWKYKFYKAKKVQKRRREQQQLWWEFLRGKFGNIPGALASVTWKRDGLRSWAVYSGEFLVGHVSKSLTGFRFSIVEVGLVNSILSTRNVLLLPNERKVLIYNNTMAEAFQPDTLSIIHLKGTLIFTKGTKEAAITLTPYKEMLSFILKVCVREA